MVVAKSSVRCPKRVSQDRRPRLFGCCNQRSSCAMVIDGSVNLCKVFFVLFYFILFCFVLFCLFVDCKIGFQIICGRRYPTISPNSNALSQHLHRKLQTQQQPLPSNYTSMTSSGFGWLSLLLSQLSSRSSCMQ